MRHLNEYQHHLRVLLEPYDAKVSRTVLRGESPSNGADLLDSKPMSELNLPSVRRRYYPVKTKLSAVRDRVINEMGYAEVLSKYEVKPSTFHVWLHKYKSRVLSEEQHKRLSSRNYKMLYPMTDQERAELETLRQEVEKQKILVEAYELMLELARERLHVDVKKNYEEMLLAGLSRDRKNGEVKP